MHNQISTRFCRDVTLACLFGLFLQISPAAFAQDAEKPEITDPETASAVVEAQKNGNPVIALETNLGTLHLELYPDKSPKSVENFVQYVEDGFYDGTIFPVSYTHLTLPTIYSV